METKPCISVETRRKSEDGKRGNSIQKCGSVLQHGNSLLGLENDCAVRITKIDNEVVKWRALLRKSEYLTNQTNTSSVYTMSGEPLSGEFSNSWNP